ncbi:ABC transporter permease [Gorillibacterium sp. sgz5001074]|uniref:ABC transporter permease n=1 Tax=Gorillibacterium sp. sgz5001074 TaxID=3446695 RepID=UPI003F667425
MNSLYLALMLVKRILGKKKHLVFLVLVPAMSVSLLMTLLGDTASDKILLETVNLDRGGLGKLMVSEWEDHTEFRIRQAESSVEAEDRVMKQKSEAALIIPEGFTEELLAGRQPAVELKEFNFTEAAYLVGNTVEAEVRQLIGTAERVQASGNLTQGEAVSEIKRIYQEKRDKAAVYRIEKRDYMKGQRVTNSTGLLLIFIMAMAGGAMSKILEDRRSMTFQRLYASPLRHWELMGGHFLGCMLVGTIQIVFVLTVSRLLSRGDYGISFGAQLLVLECFLLASLGIFAALAVFNKGAEQNNMLHSLIMTPTCMLGGCFWPVSVMPEPMQKLSNFVPQKWVVEAVAKLANGASLRDIPYHLGIVVLFGVVLLSFGTAIMNPEESPRV